ncbi:YkgJ family cysteine cluster protein [Ideonella sp. A 288]|uniref:YkgJ family cysteine cluster protein n=1 Tax=Ideonella sp. A 288 TaxID=1962181 RepID=UPI000B4AD92A|nr:YkgJ family cysteine cluster protein [Ideonella sp. A 288]
MSDPAAPPGSDWQPLHGPDRRYPARADAQQPPRDERAICERCLGGTCCTTEGPIALTAFDVLRLCAALDLPPAEFFRLFTQDRFDGADGERYRQWLADPGSSVVSFLRRRTLDAASPCLFLKYIAEPDGTPRRVCSVHPARPLACREYYHDTCRKRWTGEMAVLQAIGYEAVRDGAVDVDEVERRLAGCGPRGDDEPLSVAWRRAQWLELRRALQPEAANHEGAADPRLAAMQDAVDDKLNRLLSTPRLRFEEKYGPEPMAEQLHRYDAGLSLALGAERVRLLDIARRPAGALPLHTGDDLAPHLGQRGLVAERGAVAEPGVAAASPADELLHFAQAARRQPDRMEVEHPAALHLALVVALGRHPEAARPAWRSARAWHAAAALALCQQALQGVPASDEAGAEGAGAELDAATGLAALAQAGSTEAAEWLRRWRVTRRGRALRDTLPSMLAALPEPRTAVQVVHRLPLLAQFAPAAALRDALAALWSGRRLRRIDTPMLLTLADHCLRQPGVDRVALAPAWPALRALVDEVPASMWDARPSEVADLWHDAYVLRAIDRAGLRAEARALRFEPRRTPTSPPRQNVRAPANSTKPATAHAATPAPARRRR